MWEVIISESEIAPSEHLAKFLSLDEVWPYLGKHKATGFIVHFIDPVHPEQVGITFKQGNK